MEKYYFSFEEPNLNKKKIICAFHISNIERKRSFFFIVEENSQLVLYYSMISSRELIKFVREYADKRKLNKQTKLIDFLEIPEFKNELDKKYLKIKPLDNQDYIKKVIEKMKDDNIYNANNKIQGLDGFSVELKLNKGKNHYYAWCTADDKKYFYILDFINSILDELEIDKEYRFKKVYY